MLAGGAVQDYEEGENLSDSAPPKKKKKTDSANGDQIETLLDSF